jgi:hypothetical protein
MLSRLRGQAEPRGGAVPVTRQLPGIPSLRCKGCGGTEFIPLTYPRRETANRSKICARPTAKCVTCGLRASSSETDAQGDAQRHLEGTGS